MPFKSKKQKKYGDKVKSKKTTKKTKRKPAKMKMKKRSYGY